MWHGPLAVSSVGLPTGRGPGGARLDGGPIRLTTAPSAPIRPRADRMTGAASGRAVPADHLPVSLGGQLAAVVNQEAARAGELVRLPWQDPDAQFLVGQVGAGKLDRLLGLVAVHDAAALVHATRLEFLDAVLTDVVIGLTRGVIVSGHLSPSGGAVVRSVRSN